MTWQSKQTGLTWPDGPDYVSSEPATWRGLDAQLSGAIRITALSVADRNRKVANPTSVQRFIVSIPSLAETHVWDGKNWLIYDDRPRTQVQDAGGKYWYSGSGLTPLDVGSGTLEITTQRKGWETSWHVYLKRAADSNQGGSGEYWSWFIPTGFVGSWWKQTGAGWYSSGGAEYPCTARFIDANHVAAIKTGGGRVGQGILTGTSGEEVCLWGTSRGSGGYIK